ncbi:hypothetical protein [Streptomyces sp. NPDC002573]|uniref:hypothetical protein n=1 Tax=Streptomyces sp. NPDC002573 TaxID=3364651 RepID=UPI0036AB72F5
MQLAPSALHATAETLTGYLGTDTWHVNELITDDIISLEGPHDRQIGMRLLGNGSSIQLWATGGTQPADHQPIEGINPLPHGRRWHTPVHIGRLTADMDPGVVLYNAITDRLLPAFDAKPLYVGHRPWDPAPEAEAEADAEATTQADADQPGSAPKPKPETRALAEPKVTPPRPRRTKRADKPDPPAADAKPKPRPVRKRTSVKPTVDKSAAS